ncbi:EamA family transporter [Roseibium sp. CAU 1637]|uniref:EamA family transporter n=3 Tax=Roseibium TaxID=150830 RepID=A0A939ERE4_9HYPH|nr:EamA family transporter [Roseibium limicola]
MEIWIPTTVFAAFCQNLRSALQKHLAGDFGPAVATFVRFGFGFPFACLYVVGLRWMTDSPWPEVTPIFYPAAICGGLAQIAATFLLIKLFSMRNFAVGTAYSKTEPVQAALFGFLLLGEKLTAVLLGAIVAGVAGVILISTGKSSEKAGTSGQPFGWRNALRPAAYGLGSAALFGASAALYRLACLALEGTGFLMQAAIALACVTAFQTVVMGSWLAWRRMDQLRATLTHWRLSTLVGLAGVSGSAGWFTAMTLQQVAYVRALGQVELLFTFAVSLLVFREKITGRDVLGCSMILASVVVISILG